jgi:MFS family permease
MGKLENRVVSYTAFCHGLVHVLELTFGVVLMGIAETFGARLFVLGLLANIFGLAFGMTALPSGYLADRMSEARLLTLCCLGMGLSSIAVGLSPNVYILGGALFVLGVSVGILHPTGAAFVARIASRPGQGFGYFGIGGNLGVAFGPVIAGGIAASLGWRAAYLTFSVPALVLGLLFYLADRSLPPPEVPAGSGRHEDPVALRPYLMVLLLLFAAQVMNGLTYRGVVTFLPSYLAERVTFSFLNIDGLLLAGSFTTVALVFGVAGISLGGYLSDRTRPEWLALFIAFASAAALLPMGVSHGLALIGWASLFGFVYFMGQPVYNVLIASHSPRNWRGRIYGIAFFCVFGVGSFSATLLGYIAERLEKQWVFPVIGGFQLVVLVLAALLLHRARRRARPAPAR